MDLNFPFVSQFYGIYFIPIANNDWDLLFRYGISIAKNSLILPFCFAILWNFLFPIANNVLWFLFSWKFFISIREKRISLGFYFCPVEVPPKWLIRSLAPNIVISIKDDVTIWFGRTRLTILLTAFGYLYILIIV